ncbi:MAG TPA: TonB-dependent receptor, partial [Bryobacteraceae bacterium]
MRFATAALFVCAGMVFAQGNTARMDGNVTDPQGAAVPLAEVQVANTATGQSFKTITDERGQWAVPGLGAGSYRVAATKPGFKVATVENVAMNAGVPATVNIKLEIGQASETVEVVAGADIVQSTSASVSSTITGRQIFELPFASRNSLELLVTQPGTQTPTNPRSSSINGLPKGALNITMDGMNSQDNLLKSSDGFFSYIVPSVDAMEEVTLTTSAGQVDSTSQGAAQIKFVTKSGTNQYHGGAFYQLRNTAFDANYYFNNQNGLPRDVVKLTQRGFHVGGPIRKDKLFFFGNYEQYRLPGTKSYTRTILTDTAQQGMFQYRDTKTGEVKSVNLLQLAQANGFPGTVDPILSKTFSQISGLAANGAVRSRIASNADYNRVDLNYQPTGDQTRDFYTARIDYNIAASHQLSFVYNYDKYDSVPDFLNNVVAAYPGTGTVLGSKIDTGQRSNRFSGVLSLRSSFGPSFTNEFRGGLNGGTVLFFDAIGNSSIYSQWRGYRPIFGFGLAGVSTATSSQRRNSPVKDVADTVSWIKGSHQLSFGGNFTQVELFQQIIGSSVMPSITFGVASGDPVNTGKTGIFNTTNLPGASNSDLSNAAAMYAALTGRVSSIGRSNSLDELTHKYAPVPSIDRDRVREYGLFAQDTWRLTPSLTLSLGLRYEKQLPFVNTNNVYSRVGLEGLWGVSGVGHLFQPGVLTGVAPAFLPVTGDAYSIPAVWAPSLGGAWQVPGRDGILGAIFGHTTGASVIRAGYSIATVREGSNVFLSIWRSNQGLTQDATVSNSVSPTDFGAPGSVLFRDANLPVRSDLQPAPKYPIPASFNTALNDFDPNLKIGYVQSWNVGWQRALDRNSVVEFRYTGNHGLHLWRQYDLNEVNIVENGFLNEFQAAQNNLAIARRTSPTSNNFGNQGLPGQSPVPILQTALGTTNDVTTANQLINGQAGSTAAAISGNSGRMSNLTKAGYPANFFVVNPTVGSSNAGAFIVENDGSSFYDALQIEFRRRMSAGLSIQGSYAWAKSIANGATSSSSDFSQPTTLRNLSLDRVPSQFDIRHGLKANWIYEFPFGPGRPLLSNIHNAFARKAIEGWEMAGVARIQSGTPLFWNGFNTFN